MNSQGEAVIPDCRHGIVFLVGMARSGTTLLTELLARHPDVIATRETHFFSQFCRTPAAAGRKLAPAAADERYAVLARALRDASASVKERSFPHEVTLAVVARAAFYDLLAESGKRVLIEKTPDHALFMDAIATVIPEARFIHIVRDPRDVALSWMDMPWNPAGMLWPGLKWRTLVRAVARAERSGRYRVATVRYEDLLADPMGVLDSLVHFIGLPSADVTQAGGAPATFDPQAEGWKVSAARPLDPYNTEKWRTSMPAACQLLYDKLVGVVLDQYGYRRAGVTFAEASPIEVATMAIRECYLVGRRVPTAMAKILGRHRHNGGRSA